MQPTPRLALFDLDHTLISADTDHEWIQHLARAGALDGPAHLAKSHAFYKDYYDGKLDIDSFLQHQLAPLAMHPRESLEAWRKECYEQTLRHRIGPKPRAALERHRSRGDMCILITASCSFVAALAARDLGFEHFIGTVAETRADGSFTGGHFGTPAFHEGKITRLDEYLSARGEHRSGFSEIWFYSDSRNDIPLLEQATHPVAIDPDPHLRAHAMQRKWLIDSFRID